MDDKMARLEEFWQVKNRQDLARVRAKVQTEISFDLEEIRRYLDRPNPNVAGALARLARAMETLERVTKA